MTLRQRLKTEITAAMRSGSTLRRDTLRMAENAIYNAEKRDRRTYSDDEVAAVISREVKTRRESVEAFRAGGREDLASKEEAEIALLQAYLPAQLTSEELSKIVDGAIARSGAQGPKDMGKVMKEVLPEVQGKAEGKTVSELVKAKLASR